MSKHVNVYLLGLNHPRLSQILRLHVCKQNCLDEREKFTNMSVGGILWWLEGGLDRTRWGGIPREGVNQVRVWARVRLLSGRGSLSCPGSCCWAPSAFSPHPTLQSPFFLLERFPLTTPPRFHFLPRGESIGDRLGGSWEEFGLDGYWMEAWTEREGDSWGGAQEGCEGLTWPHPSQYIFRGKNFLCIHWMEAWRQLREGVRATSGSRPVFQRPLTVPAALSLKTSPLSFFWDFNLALHLILLHLI